MKPIALGNDISGRNTGQMLAKIINALLFVLYPIYTVLSFPDSTHDAPLGSLETHSLTYSYESVNQKLGCCLVSFLEHSKILNKLVNIARRDSFLYIYTIVLVNMFSKNFTIKALILFKGLDY